MDTPYLKKTYNDAVHKWVNNKEFPNVMACPKIVKTTLNVGIAKYRKDEKKVESVINDIARLTGQKPVITQAKKSISGFSVRKGEQIGVKVALRKNKMYDFLWILFNVAMPRTRDFRGISERSIDQRGNLSIGIKEHTVFPEIKGDEVKHAFGFEICISVNENCTREDAIKLYRELAFPLIKS